MNIAFFGSIAITAALILFALFIMALMTAGLWLYSRLTHTFLSRTRRLQLIFGVTALLIVPLITAVLIINS